MTAGTDWIYAMEDAALPEGGMAPVYPKGVNVLLVRSGGAVYALSGKCTHMACPLFVGTLDGYVLTCACHDWRFDVRTGHFLDAPELALERYEVKAEDGKLWVQWGEETRWKR